MEKQNNSKLFLIPIIAAVIFLLAAIITVLLLNSGQSANGDSSTSSSTSSAFVPQIVSEAYPDDNPNVAVTIKYPQIANAAGHVAAENFNEIVEQKVQETVNSFGEDDVSFDEDLEYSISMNYTVHHNADGLISIVMSGSVYTGGAHPNAAYYTVLFDLNSNQVIDVDDLFTNSTIGLEKLRDLAREDLVVRDLGDTDAMIAGSEATAQNYQNFFIEGDTLTIIFPPYQVAAYAVGPQQIEIPLASISAELKDDLRTRLL